MLYNLCGLSAPLLPSDVFISYSHSEIDFVCYLFDQLAARDREDYADWQDYFTDCRLAEIHGSIEAVNTFLFVINFDSVAAEIL